MMYEKVFAQLCCDLRNLGISEGNTVLVHSSLRSLGQVPGGAETVIAALQKVLGSDGTLLFPALSFRSVTAENPFFDVNNTPCCVGALPEYFRLRQGSLRSIHPTHSVCAAGRKAAELTCGHEKDSTSCGENSPFRKLREHGNWILFIGCSIAPNTSMHAVEELVEPPYLHGDYVKYKIAGAGDLCCEMNVRRHNFRNYRQHYERLHDLLTADELRYGQVLSASCALMNIPAMWQKALEALERDPFYFVTFLDSKI